MLHLTDVSEDPFRLQRRTMSLESFHVFVAQARAMLQNLSPMQSAKTCWTKPSEHSEHVLF